MLKKKIIISIFTLGACNNDEPNIDDEEQQDELAFIKEALVVD